MADDAGCGKIDSSFSFSFVEYRYTVHAVLCPATFCRMHQENISRIPRVHTY